MNKETKETESGRQSAVNAVVSGTRLRLNDNRLVIAAGTIFVTSGIRLVLFDIEVETTREFMIYRLIKEIGCIALIYMGLCLIFKKD